MKRALVGFRNTLTHDGILNRAVTKRLNLDKLSIESFSFSFRITDIEHQKLATLSF
jgi:hypothetical protein